MRLSTSKLILLILVLIPRLDYAAGTVYLVFGSDTAIWDGMSVNRYECTYDLSLYTDPARNAYSAMDPGFRSQLLDSYGQPMKMTWWMMAGNIFRYATNTNIPVPNIMTLYLMQKYHGESVMTNGDELSLHYHTFFWSDYDQDGMWYWNQALSFEESRDDWEVTLAQFLLVENVFPVSFRSGWHYMDNAWQHTLNDLLPYSMHNAWPANRTDTTEPLDNTYHWSESPASFIPFHPDLENYQIPGNSPGWNVRSASFQQVIADGLMDSVFAYAAAGTDQVACFWAHLPETDFVDNMGIMNDLAHAASALYPEVDFRYCTAIEAMQRWRGTLDTRAPEVTIVETGSLNERSYMITSDEELFQPQPFVALKYKDESYRTINCTAISAHSWETDIIPHALELAKLAVAATDTAGNLTTRSISLVPDDIYIDNLDPEYHEFAGVWDNSTHAAWGLNAREAQVDDAQPAHAGWSVDIPQDAYYHLYLQVPDNASNASPFILLVHGADHTDTLNISAGIPGYEWYYLATPFLQAGNAQVLELISALPEGSSTATIFTDVLKISANVRERDIHLSSPMVEFGAVGLGQTVTAVLGVSNHGMSTLNLLEISSRNGFVQSLLTTPQAINSMQDLELLLSFEASVMGPVVDTLIIASDDPLHPELEVIVTAHVEYPFEIVDNEDTTGYSEMGEWFFSVAQAYGGSSRYAWANTNAAASFEILPAEAGIYEISEIVPTTVNSLNAATYVVNIAGMDIDSISVDQNAGSGNWQILGRYYLPAGIPTKVTVMDEGISTAGLVLRADAIKFQMLQPVALGNPPHQQPTGHWRLEQNFPNPFNATTTIRYWLPGEMRVRITVFNIKGQTIARLKDATEEAGFHELRWDHLDTQGNLSSTGIYICRMECGAETQSIKMLNLK